MRTILLLAIAVLLAPVFVAAQSTTPTATWTKERRLIISDLPAGVKEVSLPLPADQPHPGAELAKACQQMSNEFAQWTPSPDGKSVKIWLARDTNPTWDKEQWELFLTRMAGSYLFPG